MQVETLLIRWLLRNGRMLPFALAISCCQTCLTERQNMVFRVLRRALSRCGWAGIVARKRVDCECATRNWDGEHGKTMVPLSGSSKNDAQLLHQNTGQNVLRKTGETRMMLLVALLQLTIRPKRVGGVGLMVLFNACQRFFWRVASSRV